MTWHVYPTIGSRDLFRPEKFREGDKKLRIPIDSPGVPNEVRSSRTWGILDSHRLNVQEIVVELYRVAVAAYSADVRIPRKDAFDKWTRDMALYIPTSNVELWQSAVGLMQEFLSFLTGDHWMVHVRERKARRPSRNIKKWRKGKSLKHSTVSFFSGGLDSFIGAVDVLSSGEGLALVGHYHEAITKDAQARVFKNLVKSILPGQLDLLQFYICPPKALTEVQESSSRSRSFLFLALGILVASALGGNGRLVVPENGFIGVNVPLTGTRLGSLSTRTTHPHTLHLFQAILARLGIQVRIDTPYRFSTKGEMIEQTKDRACVEKYAKTTFSCAHPSQGRWDKQDPNQQCGYCVPCLIRRAAMNRVGLDSPDDYRYDVLHACPSGTRSADLQAFLIALEHSKSRSPIASILQSGPLHATPAEVNQYVGVYERGLQEVANFLNKRRWGHL